LEGFQLKNRDLDLEKEIVLFNRRLLKQDSTALLMASEEYEQEECKKILLPSLKEMDIHLQCNDLTELRNLTEVNHITIEYVNPLSKIK
jgi:hypothetical protein